MNDSYTQSSQTEIFMSIIDVVPVIRTSFACVYARAVHTDDAEPVHQQTVGLTVGARLQYLTSIDQLMSKRWLKHW